MDLQPGFVKRSRPAGLRHGLSRNNWKTWLGSLLVTGLVLTSSSLRAQTFQTITPLQSFSVSAITGEKPQSKLWTYDGYWWAVMPNGSGSWIWRLDGTSWTAVLQISANTDTHADVKPVASVAHILLYRGTSSQLVSVEYVAPSHTYQLWSVRSSAVSLALDGGVETATIDIDGNGRMWLASDASTDINVRWSDYPYSSWSAPITIASGISTDDICVITSFPNGSVGVLWSNQNSERFGFRTHAAGTAPSSWTADEAPASQSALNVGAGMADDHLNVAVAADGTLYAAVKTSYDTGGYPKIALLVRRPDAAWDNLYEVDGSGTRAICLLNEPFGTVTVVYTSSEGAGDILYKQSYLSPISFGARHTLIAGSYNDATSTRQSFSDQVAVLASNGSVAVGALAFAGAVVTHTIAASAGANGSISPSGAVTVVDGANQAFTITPAGGYAVADVVVDGASVGATTYYTFVSVTADHSISAVFASVSQPPYAPVLVTPPDQATGVALSPELEAIVSDPDSDPLTVSFYGRPVVAVPPSDFTLVFLPDTQNYPAFLSGGSPQMFYAQTAWIAAQRDARHIAYVGHLGDCVQNGGNIGEWRYADTAMANLDMAQVPWGIVPGNHDQDPVGSPDGASTALFNQFFGVDRFADQPYYGGHFGSNNDNHFDLFSAGGLDFIVVYIEYGDSQDQVVLDWADSLLTVYATRRAIVISHNTMNTGNPGSFSSQGLTIHDALKGHANFFLALGGHVAGEGRRLDVFNGDTVYSLLADYQGRANGGDGWLRLLEFSPANNRIQVRTYSPWLDQYETDGDSEFQLPYDLTTPLPGAVVYRAREVQALPGAESGTQTVMDAFGLIGTRSGVPSGSGTAITWPDLTPLSEYEWYVTLSDGSSLTTGPIWSFTTTGDVPPLIISSPVTTATVGLAYSYLVQATGNPAPAFALVTAPAGMSIDPGTGLIQWSPTAPGPAAVTVQAVNTTGVDLQSFTIQVSQIPEITSTPATTGTAGQLYSYDVDADGIPAPSFTLLDAPAGMAIDPASGLVLWVPAVEGSYDVSLAAVNTAGSDTQSYELVIHEVPDVPTLIAPAHTVLTTDSTPLFVWSSTTGPGGSYTLQLARNAIFTGELHTLAELPDTVFALPQDSALADGVWFWHVRAMSSSGVPGAYQAAPFYFTLDTQAPGIPALVAPLSGALTTDDTPTLVWRSAAGAGGSYTLEYALDSQFTAAAVTIEPVAETTYTIGLVEPSLEDGTYFWHVRAVDAAGNAGSYQTAPFRFTVNTVVPDVPVLLAPANLAVVDDNTPTLDWSATAGPGGSYTLQYSTDPTLVVALTVGGLASPSYTIPVPAANGTYYWHVKARSSAGLESTYQPSPFQFTITRSTLAVPILVAPANQSFTTETRPTLRWASAHARAGESADGTEPAATMSATVTYTLAFGSDSTFTLATVQADIVDTFFTIPSENDLYPATWYWRVEAVDDGGRHSGFQAIPFRFGIFLTGDPNGDGTSTSADIIRLVNFIFKGGAQPVPCQAAGDMNCDHNVTAADIIYMVNYVFKGGPAPCDVGALITSGTWTCP
jgi:hypothetical protein